MALPSEGQLYSLLGQTTSSEYKRRQQEERDFKRSLRRDQMKAAQMQQGVATPSLTPDQNARLSRLEQKVDKLIKHLGVK